MRRQEAVFAGLLLIEALDEKALRSALRRAAELAPGVLGDVGDPEIYQGIFALDARIAGIE
jgi:indole-3-glycerol phosphate synthase